MITAGETDEEIVEELKTADPQWYAVLPKPVPDQAQLDELSISSKDHFHSMDGQRTRRSEGADGVELLLPPVDVDREAREYKHYRLAASLIAPAAS